MKNNLTRAVNYCSKNIRSKSEVLKKIDSWGVEGSETEKILQFLELHGFYLPDEEYLDRYLDNLSSNKGYSKIQLKIKLTRKGLPVYLISQKLDSYYKVSEDLEIQKFIKKNSKKIMSRPREVAIKYLLSKGFKYNLILKHLDNTDL